MKFARVGASAGIVLWLSFGAGAERLDSKLPLKIYARGAEGYTDRLIGFTPSTSSHRLSRPQKAGWYVQPVGAFAGIKMQILGAFLRAHDVPGLDLSDHWEISDLRFEHLGAQPQLRFLNITRTPLTDRALRQVARWTGLTAILLGENTTDKGFAILGDLPHLRELSLDRAHVTDRSLLTVLNFQDLRKIDLSGTQISDHGLIVLSKLPKLASLTLGGGITDGAASSLAHLKMVEDLDFSETQIGEAGAAAIASLPHLRSVYVNRSFGDRGLEKLSHSKTLSRLDLSGSLVTDAGLQSLGQLKNLEELALTDTQISDRGIAALAALPRLKIVELSNTRVTSDGVRPLAKNPMLSTISFSWPSLSRDDVLNLSKLAHIRTVLLNGIPLSSEVMTQLRDLAGVPLPVENTAEKQAALGKLAKPARPVADLAVAGPSHPQAILSAGSAAPIINEGVSAPRVALGNPSPAAPPTIRSAAPKMSMPLSESASLSPSRLSTKVGGVSPDTSALSVHKLVDKKHTETVGEAKISGASSVGFNSGERKPAEGPGGLGAKEDAILKAIQLHTKEVGHAATPSLSGLRSLQLTSRSNALTDLVPGEKPAIHMQEDRPENKIPDINISAGH